MTPQQKAVRTRDTKKYAAYQAAEETAKAEIVRLGYGPRFYAGKYHAIKGLTSGETYHQNLTSPGGYDSWQEALENI